MGAVLAAGSALSSPSPAAECVPARLSEASLTLPEVWRRELEALVAATAREGQPWSCPDAQIALVLPGAVHAGAPALLEVTDASGVRRRPVSSPAEVVPLGEAMLALVDLVRVNDGGLTPPKPLVDDGGLTPPKPPGGEVGPPPYGVPPPEPPGLGVENGRPRESARSPLLADLLVGVRYTGPTRAILVGPELRATMVFDRWFGSFVARYDKAPAVLQSVPDDFSLTSVTLGLAGGYRVLLAPVELSVALEPSMGVVLMGCQRPGMAEPDVDAHVDMRLGARFAAAFPVGERLRVVGAIGGEGVPAALFSDRHSQRHALPSYPGYLAGLSLGMELVAIR
jgi:hypothetical protein